MLMRNNFSLLTHKGRWLLATLTLLLTLGIGQMWAADVTLIDWTPSGLTKATKSGSATPDGGTITYAVEDPSSSSNVTTGSDSQTYYKFGSSGNFILQLTSPAAFQEGDVLHVKITATSATTVGFKLKDKNNPTQTRTGSVTTANNPIEVTATITAADINSGKIAIYRNSSSDRFGRVWVTRSSGGTDPVAVTGITISPSSPSVEVGSTVTLSATVAPNNATDKAVTWSVTSGDSYASVNASTGVVTGKAVGSATVTATAHDASGVTQNVTVTVTPLGADLTAHEPGLYEKAQANGGYGAGLITYSNRQYETYYVSYNSSKLSISAGNIAYNAEGHYNLIDNVSTSANVEVKGSDWFGIAANSYGNSGTTNKNQFNKNASTHAATLVGANKVRLKVSGYDNFSFIGRDGSTSGENMFVVKIDGETKTVSHTTTDNSIYSFDISTGEHYIEVTTNGGGSNRFRGFSLRLPQCGATAPGNISKGTLSAGVLTLNVADDPASGNKYYWQTSANGTTKVDEGEGKNEGKSYNVNAVGTYYVRSYYAADDCWSAAKSFTVAAADLVANYTVIYKDGTTELGNEVVEVGEHPTGIADPEKDCYTFAGWLNGTTPVADVTALSGSVNDVITLTATWTPKYASTIDFEGNSSAEPEVVAFVAGYNYLITNLATESEWDHGAKTGYVGYKLKDSGATIKFLAPAGKQVVITLGSVGDPVNLNKGGVASTIAKASGDNAKTVVPAFIPEEDMIVSLTTTSGSTVTLKKIAINTLYSATLYDGTSDASVAATPMAEIELPTPTAVENWTFLGWKADKAVTVGGDEKAVGTMLAAGTTAVLGANTIFTAQWKPSNAVAQIGETYYTNFDDAVTYANANASSVIVLLTNINRDERITLTADATLNLNGYTFGKTNGGWLIFVKEGATLTIDGTTDNSAVYGGISLGAATNNNGSLVLEGGSYSCGDGTACIHINGTCLNSNVTINGATITNDYDNAIQFNGKGTFTITDATITGATGIYIKSGEMTITNSTVTGTMAPANYSYYGNGANATGDGIVVDACNYPGGAPTVNIVSGTFSGTKSAVGNYNYQGTSEPAVGGITGGTYNTPVPAALCADTYVPTPVAGDKYSVIVGKLVKYVANGGTGEMVELGYAPATEVTVLANGFTAPANKKFDKWTVTGLTVTEAVAGDVFEMPDAEVTLTAQWIDAFTVTYNANGGTCATTEAAWAAGDEQLVLPTATKSNYVITGWYDSENHLVGRAGGKYTPTASIELFAHYVPNIYEASYSNHFDGFINPAAQTITVYYLEGESAPTLSSIKVLGVSTPAFIDNGDNVVITVDAVDYTFEVTKTAVEAYTGTGLTFAGTESYVKTGNGFSTSDSKKGWIYARNHKEADGEDYSREAAGKNRIYFFLGAAQSIKLTSGVSGNARPIKVYRNGVEVFSGNMPKSGDETNYITFNGSNSPAMYELVSNQSSGDGSVKAIEITPWVPVESIVLKEGTTAISSKEIAEGAQFTLTAEVTPANASNPNIVWESENDLIASVANGVVTGEASGGPVNIIARSQDNNTIYATCAVTVAAPCTPSTITWDVQPTDGVKGGNGSASVITNYAAGLEVTSSDPTVASVSNDGVNITINYLKKGTTKITATVIGDGSTYCNTPVFVEKTITVEPDCPAVGNLFSLEFLSPTGDDKTYTVNKNNDPVQIQPAAATITNGEAYFHTSASSNVNIVVEDGECAFRNTNSNNYIKLEFECPLQVGDIISFTSSVNRQLNFYKDNTSGTAVTTASKKITIDSNGHALYGATVLCIKGGNQDCKVQTISIDRPAQITLNGNGGKIGDETSVVVPAIGATQLPNARKAGDFYFVGWALDQEGNNMVANPYTPTATTVTLYAQYDDCVAQGTVYKFEVATRASGVYIFENGTSFPASAAMTTDNYLSTLVGGDLTASVTSSSGNYQNIYIDNSGVDGVTAFMTQSSYGVLTMDLGCPLKAGDVIRYNIVSDSGKKLTLKDDNNHSVNIFGNNANEVDEINVPADFVGATQLTLNYNGGACRIASFEVYRRPAVTGVTLADLTIAKATAGTPAMTLLPSDDAYVASQAWSIVGEGAGTIANINATTGAVTGIAEGDVTVKVVLNGDNNLSATCTVHVISDYTLATVDGSAVWDWNDVPGDQINSDNGVGVVLANKIAPTATFKSDELEIFMQYLRRTSNNKVFCQGQKIHMETTVPGILKVTFRNTGGNGKRTVQVNGIFSSDVYSENSGTDATYVCLVPAGPVNIEAVQLNADGEFQELSYIQIHKIEFDADPDHHREGLSSSNIGTLCWTNNAVIWGATLYEFAGKNENNYLVFDEVVDNRIEAGKPYIFLPENGQTEIKVFNMDNADALTEADLQPVNNMYGTFEGKDLRPDQVQDADMYYFSGHNIWRVGDFTVEKITIPAYRCYVDYPAVLAGEPAAAPAPGRRRVTMGVQGSQIATGIENLNASDKPMKLMINGQIFILRGEKLFDATGRLVK